MRTVTWFFLCASMLSLLHTGPCRAEDGSFYEIKLEHDTLKVPLRKGWKLGVENKLGPMKFFRFFPEGETADKYSATLTVTTAGDVARIASAKALMTRILDAQENPSMSSMKYHGSIVHADRDDDVTFEVSNAAAQGLNERHSITRIVTGSDGMYLLQYDFPRQNISEAEKSGALSSIEGIVLTSAPIVKTDPVPIKGKVFDFENGSDKLTIPIGEGWAIASDRKKEVMPIFQYEKQTEPVRTVTLVPVGETAEKFTRCITIESAPGKNQSMTSRQVLDSIFSAFSAAQEQFKEASCRKIDDKSDNDVSYELIIAKPIPLFSTSLGPLYVAARLLKGADGMYKIVYQYPRAEVNADEKKLALDMLSKVELRR